MSALESLGPLAWCASWQAGLLVLLVTALGLVLRRMPARWLAALWIVVLVRLLVPIVPSSPLSLFNWTRVAAPMAALAPLPSARTNAPRGDETKFTGARASTAPSLVEQREHEGAALPRRWPAADFTSEGFVLVWLIGVGFLLSHRLLLAIRLRRLLGSCHVVDEGEAFRTLEACRRECSLRRRVLLLATDRPIAPAPAGVLRPRILLSTETLRRLDAEELAWLFRHELMHVRRGDVAWQLLWSLARAVHWFNPLVWWAASQVRRQTELACDEAVLRRAGAEHLPSYGQTLLKVAEAMLGAQACRPRWPSCRGPVHWSRGCGRFSLIAPRRVCKPALPRWCYSGWDWSD